MKSVETLLEPFIGYLELEMFSEAQQELENLPVEIQSHPAVLHAKLALQVEMGQWEEGVISGKSFCQLWPGEHEFFFKTAYCLHELKRTREARETLMNAPQSIRKTALYFYNLACYETQLGHLLDAKELLKICFAKDPTYRQESVDDPDLKPLKSFLAKL